MFQRVLHDHWTTIVPVISFVLTASVFGIALIRSLRMKKGQVEALAKLPLDED